MLTQGKYGIKVVTGRCFTHPFRSAVFTDMYDGVTPGLHQDTRGTHCSAAEFRAISRIDIDVLTPQTPRAVVRIPITADIFTAVITNEILFFNLKFSCHSSISIPILTNSYK